MQYAITEKGNTMLEMLFAILVLIFSALGVVEVVHMLSFKNKLYAVATEISQQISQQHLYVLKLYDVAGKPGIDRWISEQVDILATNYFSSLENTRYRVGLVPNVKIIMDESSSGVYLKLTACYTFHFLPSLASPLRKIHKSLNDIEAGILLNHEKSNRNCVGQFTRQPGPQVSLFEAVYVPWPASSEMYLKGISDNSKRGFLGGAMEVISVAISRQANMSELIDE